MRISALSFLSFTKYHLIRCERSRCALSNLGETVRRELENYSFGFSGAIGVFGHGVG